MTDTTNMTDTEIDALLSTPSQMLPTDRVQTWQRNERYRPSDPALHIDVKGTRTLDFDALTARVHVWGMYEGEWIDSTYTQPITATYQPGRGYTRIR